MMLLVIAFSSRESARSRDLGSIILVGPFQFELFCVSVVSDVFFLTVKLQMRCSCRNWIFSYPWLILTIT